MGKPSKGSPGNKTAKEREESWKNIFEGLVYLIQDQQRQLESLAKERRLQHDRLVLMKRDFKTVQKVRLVEAAKANLILGMKQREATMYKLKFEDVEDERGDLKLLFDELARCSAEPKRATRSNSKDTDLSALKAERDFVWNQYKKTESKLQEQVKRTKYEAQAADDKIQTLISDLEQLQSSNMEKDRTIVALKDDVAMLEAESRKKSEEVSRLSKELELLRKSRSESATPVLHRCTVESGPSNSRGNNKPLNGMLITTKKDLHHSQVTEKGCRSSKRKAIECDSPSESPRLFSSKFKVPKLKSPS